MLTEVAVLTPSNQTYFNEIILGIGAIAATHDWLLSVITPLPETDHRFHIRQGVHRAVIHTAPSWAQDQGAQLSAPIMVAADIDLSSRGIPSVLIDNQRVGELAAEHLLETGLHSFAAVAQMDWAWSRDRVEGFTRRISRKRGVRCGGWTLRSTDPELQGERPFLPEHLIPWLQRLPRPTGVFAGCDRWAAVINGYCRLAGLRVPEDIAIIGVDNDPFTCELGVPPISSIALPLRRLGTEVALMVDRLLDGQRLPSLRLVLPPAGVVARRSTDVLAVDDPDVAAALAVIRASAGERLTVRELLRRVPASQHRLERGFRRYLGRTMLQEIRRVHVQRAALLLAQTHLTPWEVAARSGFPTVAKLTAAFRIETGMTPTTYRKQLRQRPARRGQ